jgi:hypothetical protein
LEENRAASDQTIGKLSNLLEVQDKHIKELRGVAEELVGLRQTTILGQMLVNWDSENIRFSAVRSEWLIDKNGKPRTDEDVFKSFDDNDPFSQDRNMAIPRFFETLEELTRLGVIEEPVALSAFHAKASYYWYRYETLIMDIRNSKKYPQYQFPGFERFTKYRGIFPRNEDNSEGGGGS